MATLILKPYAVQYDSISFSIDWREVGEVEIRLRIASCLQLKKSPLRSVFMLETISFTNIMKSKEELGSPYLTPEIEFISLDVWRLCLIIARTVEYIALIAFVIFELTLSANSFCQSNTRFILSKHLS